jgi:predicted unusual protein kinase regulating ubiquinone biosynthesis (AarF/ABC1/UbiB family)
MKLGRTVAELFATFDPEPLAAASIGQAHAAIDSVDRSGPRRYPVDSMDG